MNKLFLYLFEPLNNLRKWFYIAIITVLFLSAFFFFVGAYSNVLNTNNFTVSLRNNETYLSYCQMYIEHPIETLLNDEPTIHDAMIYLHENDKDELIRVNKETNQFLRDLYDMQNDDFILEYNCHRAFSRTFNCVQVDESFFEHEYLPIFKGRTITKEDFEEIRNSKDPFSLVINVIAGYSYSKKYELGDIIRKPGKDSMLYYEYDGKDLSDYTLGIYDQEFASFRVVGFIEEGITYANSSGSIKKTDDEVFVPCIPPIFFTESIEGKSSNGTYTEPWKILIRHGKMDEYSEIINQKLDGLFIDQYYDLMDSYNQAYEILDEVVTARKDSFLIIAIVLFLFSVSGITVSTVNKFKRNTKSYTIHMTVGATNKDIYIFAAVEMLMQILIALIILHIPYIFNWVDMPIIKFINRNIPYMRSPVMYILLFAFAVIFVAVTVGVTAYCLKKYSLAEAIKGKE